MGIRQIIMLNNLGIPYWAGNYISASGRGCDIFSKDEIAKRQDPTMLGDFFTTLQNKGSDGGVEIQSIEYEKFKFLAMKGKDVVTIFNIDIKDNKNEYKDKMQIALDTFENLYGPKLENWSFNTLLFDSFQFLLEKAEVFGHIPEFRKNCIECEVNRDCSFRMISRIEKNLLKEKMNEYPKMNFFKKFIVFIIENRNYWIQKKRYVEFVKKITQQELANLSELANLEFKSIILEKIKEI